MCDFTDCVKAARHLLKEGGRFIVVHRADRLMDVLTEMRNGKIEPKKLTFVYSKANKSAQTIVVEGRRWETRTRYTATFYIYNQDGTYSDEMKGIYYG